MSKNIDTDIIVAALEAALAVLKGEAEPEVEAPAPKVKATKKAAPAAAKKAPARGRKNVEPEPEEEDEDDDEDEDADDREAELTGMGPRALRNILKTDHGWTPADYKGMDVDALVDAIIKAEDALEDEDDEDEDDDEDADDEDDADEDEEDEDEDDDEDDDEGYDPDSMSLAELKALAKQYKIKLPAKVTREKLVDLIFGDED